jgi:membrane protein YqaA with SNARE-associated domain
VPVLPYAGLFFLSFLAATVLPLSSETSLGALVAVRGELVVPVLVATVGNVLGSCTTYWIGRRAARALVEPHKVTSGRVRAERLLRRYGGPALLLSSLPVLGDALVALAGATKVPFRSFLFWVTLGKGVRYAVVAWTVSGF